MPGTSPVWEARTGTPPAADLVSYGACVDTDAALVEADLAGSIAHVVGLHAADLVTGAEATTLIEGLQALAEDVTEGELELDPALEDVHMNLENALEATVGDVAGKLHTGRSRNDQVALDLVLATRQGLVEIAHATHGLATALAQLAAEHTTTPWPLHTHGVPAQPATLGYLLHAHALRFTQDTHAVLDAFATLDESPLGSGAGAGSTLPLDPSLTAGILGLSPPENALLATGTRDGSIQATHLAAVVGRHAQALAVDLLDLASLGAVQLPAAYTTGSSIMPHKANPDALELVRADAGQLAALADQVDQTTSGLGLGYHRDLQRTKPPLLDALELAPTVVDVLTNVVAGLTIDEEPLAERQSLPGVATTDAVEALVQQGVPFRAAHQHVSQACQQAEAEGIPIADALADHALDPEALASAIAALETGDPAHRGTHGGPAPGQVDAKLEALTSDLEGLEAAIVDAGDQARQPFSLLETEAALLIEAPAEVVA